MSIKKQLASSLATLALGAALIGGGTFAYFSDVATSAGNTFATGTIDINKNYVETLFNVDKAKPGDLFSASYTIQNSGSLDANFSLKFDYTATDGAADGSDLGRILEIKSFQYDGVNIGATDKNGNGYVDLNDIKGIVFAPGEVKANGAAKNVTIAGVFRETGAAQNEYQGDGLSGTFTFEAMQK